MNVLCVKVVAEDVPELSLKYEVVAVPTFVLVKVSCKSILSRRGLVLNIVLY